MGSNALGNTMGDTRMPHEALGAPLRLAYNTDGSVKFSKSGRPVIKVAKDIADNVRLVRENFVAGLQSYANTVITEKTEAYKEQVKLARDTGEPIAKHDKAKLDEAMANLVEQAIAEAEAKDSASSPQADNLKDGDEGAYQAGLFRGEEEH